MKDDLDKVMVVKAVISKIEEEGNPYKIEVKDLKEYKTPDRIVFKGKDGGFIPDIVVHYEKATDLYEIELSNHELPVKKWSLLSLYAKNKKGHLFLVVPDFKKEQVRHELNKNSFNIGLIYFDTNSMH